MDTQKYTLSSLRQDIVDNNLHVKAIIQDILAFRGTIIDLENYNEAGRAKLAALRKSIEKLDDYASDEGNPIIDKEVDTYRQQFSRTLQAFRKANIQTMLEIEKLEKQELFNIPRKNDDENIGNDDKTNNDAGTSDGGGGGGNSGGGVGIGDKSSSASGLRHRTSQPINRSSNHSRSNLISQHDSVTDKMLSISRHLAETTQKSAATLETLVASSANVEGTRDELQMTAGTISQSGKLLKKYGRRETTDKALMLFAFAFFLACVIYIIQKRLF